MSDWSDIDSMIGSEYPQGGLRGIIEQSGAYDYQNNEPGGGMTGGNNYPQRIIVNDQGNWEVYTGPGLVRANGTLLKDGGNLVTGYNLDEDPGIVYSSLSPGARNDLLQKLDVAGFFTVGGPGNVQDELRAIQNLMATANIFGLELNNMVDTRLAGMPVSARTGSGYRRVVTSAEDLKVVARQVSQQTLGRELNEAELNQFVAAYQGRERAGGGGTALPGADVAAQEFSRQVAPTEANAYEYLGYMNQLFSLLGVR